MIYKLGLKKIEYQIKTFINLTLLCKIFWKKIFILLRLNTKMEKRYEQIKLIELKERALELNIIMQTSNYKLNKNTEKDLIFVYNNLLGKEFDPTYDCVTCLKRIRREIGMFLKDNPITKNDEILMTAWKNKELYKESRCE